MNTVFSCNVPATRLQPVGVTYIFGFRYKTYPPLAHIDSFAAPDQRSIRTPLG